MPPNITTSSISKARASRPHTGGLGVHTESPKRARKTKTQKRKLKSYFHDDENEKKRKRLAFLQGKSAPPAPSEPIIVDPPEDRPQLAESEPEDWVDDNDMADDTSRGPECNGPLLDASMDDSLVADSANLPPKRLVPDEAARELYQRWKALVPSLANPLLTYLDSTIGKEWTRPAVSLKSECSRGGQCRTTKSIVTGLFFAGFMQHTVQSCQCESACHALLRSGLFPTSPSNPRQAISVELLDLSLALTARSSDAVTAMAAALNTTYRNRGFIIANAQGNKVKEPFREGLGYALQWYDCVRIEIERLKENAIVSKFTEPFQVSSGMDPNDVPPPSSRSLTMQDSGPAECLGILESRCAACFGGKKIGRPLEKGGGIHVAVDANFNHRHLPGPRPRNLHPVRASTDLDSRFTIQHKRKSDSTPAETLSDAHEGQLSHTREKRARVEAANAQINPSSTSSSEHSASHQQKLLGQLAAAHPPPPPHYYQRMHETPQAPRPRSTNLPQSFHVDYSQAASYPDFRAHSSFAPPRHPHFPQRAPHRQPDLQQQAPRRQPSYYAPQYPAPTDYYGDYNYNYDHDYTYDQGYEYDFIYSQAYGDEQHLPHPPASND